MTGANRLLIGVGWAAVVLLWYYRSKQKGVTLPGSRRTDLGFLFIATLWAMKLVILKHIDLFDTAVFGAMFVVYILHAAREEHEEPELVGPPLALAALPTRLRRIVTALLDELDDQGFIDHDLWCIDGTVIRASRAAAGAKKKGVRPAQVGWTQGGATTGAGADTCLDVVVKGKLLVQYKTVPFYSKLF